MVRIYVGGAGGAPSNNFIRSLREPGCSYYVIGASSVPADLFLADLDERHVVPPAVAATYPQKVLNSLAQTKPEFMHVQNDAEVRAVSQLRESIGELGVKLFLPGPETVENCLNKFKSYAIWRAAGIPVPETILLHDLDDLKRAFDRLGEAVWIRATEGAGGRGALPTDSFTFARLWIDRFQGWGQFTAAKLLTDKSVTWLSIWFEGELVVAQTRRRRSWNFANRTLSGITGITGVGETCSDATVDRIAQGAIWSIDQQPHGIFGVDMTYDADGLPNVTEINIGRFFTTHYFFTKAGLNMPKIYCDIALEGKFPVLAKKINPLPDGLVWIRGMDVEPILTTAAELDQLERCLTH